MAEDDAVGVCTECKSDQPDQYMDNSPFNQPPCRYCGAPTVVVLKRDREAALRQVDRDRKLGMSAGKSYKDYQPKAE
jgi:hypothetical protein